ncbi:SDR family NAD(P)-dependent oxidoreductase, partial [Paenibacillus forsythiae]
MKRTDALPMEQMDRLLCGLLWEQLQALGWFNERKIMKTELGKSAKLPGYYSKWLEASILFFIQYGYLKDCGDHFQASEDSIGGEPGIWQIWERQTTEWLGNTDIKSQLTLVDATIRALPDILSGRVQATEILFPDASMELVEGIYKHNPIADYFNDVLADCVEAYVVERLAQEPAAALRILEIGAGTGGTSAVVLQRLEAYRTSIEEYCYTDISKAFLFHAEKEFVPDRPFLAPRLFNVEEPIESQGIEAGAYDLVIATNVLHATKQIRQTVRNAKAVLKRNGLMLLNEMSMNSVFTHLTFGLLEGWWLYEDAALRIPGCPGLTPESWQGVLEDEGFKSLFFPAMDAHNRGQQIIVAESDGLVRQNNNHYTYPVERDLRGQVKAMESSLLKDDTQPRVIAEGMEVSEETLRERGTALLKKLVGESLKIPAHKLDAFETLETYGVDSIVVVQLAEQFKTVLPNASSTLFFEYPTIDALTRFFIENHREKLLKATGLIEEAPPCLPAAGAVMAATPMKEKAVNASPASYLHASSQSASIKESLPTTHVNDIAIIGLSGRYPDADDVSEYWQNLKEGRNCVTEIPQDRWDWRNYFDPAKGKKGTIYSKWGGFIRNIDKFDPLFFQISPKEAEQMDPQERLFLQEAYACIEDAGYTAKALSESGKVGVFVGVMNGNYPSGASYWSAANRLSYLLNFRGPSLAVDTACSSSLTAIHLALESIYSGVSECAIAGGVNLIVDPVHYMKLSAMNMLTPGDRCRSFGEGADGFVDGEGVGAVLLKPLQKAVTDGDHIYGVIKGSMLNAGGRTNGYTVPSPGAQCDLVADAFSRARINARTVSYLEAHGTGTALGDPIEIEGLTRAFEKDTKDRQFCAIGSAKSGIGHCESAAGIAGLTKVLLQMKHGQLVPSLHAASLNSNIDFRQTPFTVQRELAEWKRPVIEIDGKTAEYPRIAGISSFGAGGANAHVVIEEYIPAEDLPAGSAVASGNLALIVLSAKNEERLKEKAQLLISAVTERKLSEQDLYDIAYTLQVGREAMEERLAFAAASITEMLDKLAGYLDGRDDISSFYQGRVKPNKESIALFSTDEDLQRAVEAWLVKRKYGKFLDLWVKGMNLDWLKLYDGGKPRRISLPTYPFAKESYWISGSKTLISKPDAGQPGHLHPLLQRNTSDLGGLRFTSDLSGDDLFFTRLADGQRLLNGSVLLEMARAAASHLIGAAYGGQGSIVLKSFLWHGAVLSGESSLRLHIELYSEDDSEIAFEIYKDSEMADAPRERIAEGTILIGRQPQRPVMDLAFETRTGDGLNDVASGEQALDRYERSEGTVRLILPDNLVSQTKEYGLSSFMLDTVLQLACSQDTDNEDECGYIEPRFLEELVIYETFSPVMWASIRFVDQSETGGCPVMDIDFCEDGGRVCASFKGLRVAKCAGEGEMSPRVQAESQAQKDEAEEDFELMTFEEVWKEKPLSKKSETKLKNVVCFLSESNHQQLLKEIARETDPGVRLIFIAQDTEFRQHSKELYGLSRHERHNYDLVIDSILKDFGEPEAFLHLWPLEDAACIQDCSSIVYSLQAIVSARLESARIILAAPFRNDLEHCFGESWLGFERSVPQIRPQTEVSVILHELSSPEAEGAVELCLTNCWNELYAVKAESVTYQTGRRWVSAVQPVERQDTLKMLKQGGTYLITGGCGGLGRLFAKHLAKKYSANLILTGRSAVDSEKQQLISELERLGAKVFYAQADVCDRISMQEAIQQARNHFQTGLDGVLHAAGLESGQSLMNKDMSSFERVLGPKVSGTLVLEDVLQNETLDFLCYFSSTSAILGDFGSCDYAVANRFQAAYARYRNKEKWQKGRPAKVMAILWPLWKNGGMKVGEDGETKLYLSASGQRELREEEGVALFENLLGQKQSSQMVLAGKRGKVYRLLGLTQETAEPISPSVPSQLGKGRRPEMKGFTIEQCLEWDLKELVHRILMVTRDRIDTVDNLAEFGFDSITLTEFATLLTQQYGIEITPALFFGHSTLEKLIGYYLSGHREVIEEYYRERLSSVPVSLPSPGTLSPVPRQRASHRRYRQGQGMSHPANQPEPIAIIGMSGRFPQARNTEAMWRVLSEGVDAVHEASEERRSLMGDTVPWRCGWVSGVDEFDPLFFEISPKEAELMDPRQRLLLQESWAALEDAGYGAKQIGSGKIGMFVGAEDGDYQFHVKETGSITSNHNAMLAARLSYFLNLNGPVMTINTACSSGLVAAHQACLSLLNQECDTAIAAGVNLMLTPMFLQGMSRAGMLSADGKCFAFDRRANGMVPGEAVAAVVLKRLSQAEKDGDPIYAVIKGSGINYDGKTNGITVPSGVSQASLLKSMYERYNVNPEEIEYIVTHGTGTKLGDPVEINALYETFKEYTAKREYCALTSSKTNFGHTFAASGLVSLIGLVQAMNHQTIPASLHCEQENEYINWRDSPFYINKMNKHWPERPGKRRTGAVSAFGMSGTNAHMLIESYSAPSKISDSAPYQVLALSAKSEEALRLKITRMVEELQNSDGADLEQISYTLLEGRWHHPHRIAVVVQDKDHAIHLLTKAGDGEKLSNMFRGKAGKGFSGQKAIEQLIRDLLTQSYSQRERADRYQETLLTLADLYCQGYEIDWNMLFEGEQQRVHLSAYPFAQERYFIGPPASIPSISTADFPKTAANLEKQKHSERSARWIKKHWEPFEESATRTVGGTVVILSNDETHMLASKLSKYFSDAEIIDISNDLTFIPQDRDFGKNYDGCIDLIGCGGEQEPSLDGMTWLQQFIDDSREAGITVLGVTAGLESFANEHIRLTGAMRASLYRMLQSEYRKIRSRHLDVERLDDIAVGQIAAEFILASKEPEISYRGGKRFKSILKDIRTSLEETSTPMFPQDQVLWITGGTRGLGALCARHFVTNYGVKRLLLSGKEPLPHRNDWEDCLKRNEAAAAKIRLIQDLEAEGVQVQVRALKMNDPEAMENALKEVRAIMGPIGGILHCAGTGDREHPAFIRKPIDRMREVMEPKVSGLRQLYECVKSEPLRFFVLFSSVSAAVPALASGQSDYAMANAYMDYFAEAHSLEAPIVSIQWPSWKETGMGEVKSAVYENSGLLSLSNAEGLSFLDGVLSGNPGSVILPVMVDAASWQTGHLAGSGLRGDVKPETLPMPSLGGGDGRTDSLFTATQNWLLQMVAKELKLDPAKLEVDTPFQDYGADSIILAQLMKFIGKTVQAEIDPSILYEYATISSLAKWLSVTYASVLAEAIGGTVPGEVTGGVAMRGINAVETAPAAEAVNEPLAAG